MFTGLIWRLFVLGACILAVICARCMQHHQKTYCMSFSVTYVQIFNQTTFLDHYIYAVKVKNVYKGNKTVNSAFYIARPMNMTQLNIGDKYMILEVSDEHKYERCHGNIWEYGLPKYYRRFLRKKYKTGCDCVSAIGNYSIERRCYWHYAYMKKQNGICTWIGNKKFDECERLRLLDQTVF